MADLFDNDFADAAPPATQTTPEEDPAAAFLAREENEIAGLESEALGIPDDEFVPVADQTTEVTVNGFDDMLQSNEGYQENLGNDDDFFNAPVTQQDTNFLNGGLENESEVEQMDPSQAYAAIAAADARIQQLRSEPEKIVQWREEHNKMLEDKDLAEEEKKQQWVDTAKKELEDWEKNRLEQLQKTKENNRIAEDEFIKERDFNRPGSDWEKVAKLCDFNPKVSKSTKDVSRMRSTLLQIKQHNVAKPTKAA